MPKFTGTIKYSLEADDQDRAEKLTREMVGAAKAVVPQENKLDTAYVVKEYTAVDALFDREQERRAAADE